LTALPFYFSAKNSRNISDILVPTALGRLDMTKEKRRKEVFDYFSGEAPNGEHAAVSRYGGEETYWAICKL
jgi:hypothetical protein